MSRNNLDTTRALVALRSAHQHIGALIAELESPGAAPPPTTTRLPRPNWGRDGDGAPLVTPERRAMLLARPSERAPALRRFYAELNARFRSRPFSMKQALAVLDLVDLGGYAQPSTVIDGLWKGGYLGVYSLERKQLVLPLEERRG